MLDRLGGNANLEGGTQPILVKSDIYLDGKKVGQASREFAYEKRRGNGRQSGF
jgi:hypothetical protein